ncbi:hypothetical protein [Paraburkholderia saeva]|jgi:hypothetical protein|uniref:Uncharacterized protein n=1 Tax=Paraburkholderia saeva TaxID=2777537 RepID=A0A9N8RT17_9BURK|nr:hypothetical protein [Paraburkholderia saeva]CAG4888526.1 hypothetical protein LMG31841_00692 [Paraburkholderia saeva]CAG4900335.1 hypothetical protein R70241_02738 [Paraburkholderia saeva]CAG4908271.1 hypothetical protein R52603_03611 [Paraburkholderia saeva]
MVTLIDHDIAHITHVMRPSLYGNAGVPILPTSYWRKRLHHLLDAWHVTKAQLCAIDSLLLELDHYDRDQARITTGDTVVCQAVVTPASRSTAHARRNASAA